MELFKFYFNSELHIFLGSLVVVLVFFLIGLEYYISEIFE